MMAGVVGFKGEIHRLAKRHKTSKTVNVFIVHTLVHAPSKIIHH